MPFAGTVEQPQHKLPFGTRWRLFKQKTFYFSELKNGHITGH
jgi:hypothetical protein